LVKKNRVEYEHGWVNEWYINDPTGLEQGFTIPRPLKEWKDGNIRLNINVGGSLHTRLAEDGQAVDFYGNGNVAILHYGSLKVTDASGKVIPSWFEGIPGGLMIVAEAGEALYPVTVDPVITTPAWTAQCGQWAAHMGWSVSTAGDVNGDGYSDVIVSAKQYDSGQTDEGAAFFYLGSASGLGTTPQILQKDQAYAEFGTAVSTVGDINGDGYSDVAVGAYYWDGVHADDGAVFVYLGSAAGLVTPPVYQLDGGYADGGFGGAVDTAGDINGDGYSDMVTSAIKATNPDHFEGAAFLYYGAPGGLNTTPLVAQEATPQAVQESTPQATEHSPEERKVAGKTTLQDVLDWGVSKETIETILGNPLPPASTVIKDYCSQKGLTFSDIKTRLQEEVDKAASN